MAPLLVFPWLRQQERKTRLQGRNASGCERASEPASQPVNQPQLKRARLLPCDGKKVGSSQSANAQIARLKQVGGA
ncbi:hypothetical protein A4R35_10600 [Thermogemmatispora tikiterensis]|uniref:Uncharacterized protein n=1 Tax=Thermogemmatispora tikiterensis TaxID=1825093 RepID=A0A328VLH9_9CHLR|nr:hypothetical protein A4R35_10600 [Thermogemmatispora tikiterensis]